MTNRTLEYAAKITVVYKSPRCPFGAINGGRDHLRLASAPEIGRRATSRDNGHVNRGGEETRYTRRKFEDVARNRSRKGAQGAHRAAVIAPRAMTHPVPPTRGRRRSANPAPGRIEPVAAAKQTGQRKFVTNATHYKQNNNDIQRQFSIKIHIFRLKY